MSKYEDVEGLKRVMNEGLEQVEPAHEFLKLRNEIKDSVAGQTPPPALAMRLDYEPETQTAKVEILFNMKTPDDIKPVGNILRDTMVKIISNKPNEFTAMIPSKKQIVDKLNGLRKQREEFILKKTPRLHRLLMEAFPHLKGYFKYSVSDVKDEPGKFILLREKRGKMREIAKNF